MATRHSFTLDKNEIIYWDIDISNSSPVEISCFYPLLSDVNQARASLFKKEKDRSLFIAAHYALDTLLVNVFHIEDQVTIDQNGKPYIKNQPIHFNLSHSESRILVGFSHFPIGVDIEKNVLLPDLDLLIESTMHPDEIPYFRGCDPEQQLQYFYDLWTKKEAIVKGMGIGLGKEFNTFSLDSIIHDLQWKILELEIKDGYSAAIATQIDSFKAQGFQLRLPNADPEAWSLLRLIKQAK